MSAPRPWWTDLGEIRRLYLDLWERCEAPTPGSDMAYFLAKPWKWTPEYERMCAEDDAAIERNLEESIACAREGRAQVHQIRADKQGGAATSEASSCRGEEIGHDQAADRHVPAGSLSSPAERAAEGRQP